MKEVNQFIIMQANGATISEAGQCFIDAGMSADYPEFIHKKFKKLLSRLALVFETESFSRHSTIQAISDLTSSNTVQPVTEINARCVSRGFNLVCFSRCNILVYPDFNPVKPFSLNPLSRPPPNAVTV